MLIDKFAFYKLSVPVDKEFLETSEHSRLNNLCLSLLVFNIY